MEVHREFDESAPMLSRRRAIAAGGVCLAMLSRRVFAAMDAESASASGASVNDAKATFAKEVESDGMVEITGIHHGKGTGRARLFRFGGASAPAYFLIYDLPPGASEGVHVHYLDDRNKEGSFDEYYYIISGRGQMEIDGKIVAVTQGDHVHTPLEVAHGVENTHPSENLRVFLTFIQRGNEPSMMGGATP
jgi:oxalate decarboxylase/phosphoglucose isomerase-like protein (cupin superfamily)